MHFRNVEWIVFLVSLCLNHEIYVIFRLIHSLKSEAPKSEDMLGLLQETQEAVRLAVLNCYLDFAGIFDW